MLDFHDWKILKAVPTDRKFHNLEKSHRFISAIIKLIVSVNDNKLNGYVKFKWYSLENKFLKGAVLQNKQYLCFSGII